MSEKKKKKEWKELSGRKEGKDGYQFGDVTRSLWSRFTGGSSESDDEKEKEDDGKKEREEKEKDRVNSTFSIRKTIENIHNSRKERVKVRAVNTNTGQILESVDTADSRGWASNEFVFVLVGATLSRGGIRRNTKTTVRKCFVQFELQEKWHNRTLPDGSTVRWGHRGDIQKSKVISLCSDLCFYRADIPEDVTFRFKTRTFDAQIVVSLIEVMANQSVKVLGQTTITAHELMLRDLDQIVPIDAQIRNVSATEMFPLKPPKDEDTNIGFLRMRASYVVHSSRVFNAHTHTHTQTNTGTRRSGGLFASTWNLTFYHSKKPRVV